MIIRKELHHKVWLFFVLGRFGMVNYYLNQMNNGC